MTSSPLPQRPPLLITLLALVLLLPYTRGMAAQAGHFSGTWTASGQRTVLEFGADREVATFYLRGQVRLEKEIGAARNFWSECIGLRDTKTGATARCVWKSLDGQKIYSVLEGRLLQKDVTVNGEFVGGSGAAQDITGNFSFTWSTLLPSGAGNMVTGYAKNLAGDYRIP